MKASKCDQNWVKILADTVKNRLKIPDPPTFGLEEPFFLEGTKLEPERGAGGLNP